MNALIYLDTNIYIDFFEDRTDRLRPLGEFAFGLIKKSLDCHYKIITSNVLIDELMHNGYEKEIIELTSKLKIAKKLINVEFKEGDNMILHTLIKERKTPFNDTKHAILAQRAGAKFFVTRNMKDFEELQDLITPVYPETL